MTQTMEISFINKVEKAYIITYDADLVLASDDKTVSNRVEMNAKNKKAITSEVSESKDVSYNEISGGGKSVRTNFFLKKVSQGENGQRSPLAGVEIEVINNLTKKVVLRKKTNEKGIIAVNGVTTGKYTIKEIGTPAGHFVSEELKNGKEIIVTKESDKEEKAIEIINKKSRVEFTKVSDTNKALSGAVFELSRKNETGDYIVDSLHSKLTSDQNGIVSIEGLTSGEYRITEVSAPAGYVLDTTPRDFTLTGQETDVLTLDNVINYQGSASLVKTDIDGKSLPGAEFTLTNLTDPTFKLVQTSDINGKVTFSGLAPGKYAVKETKAPKGYMLNETAETFEIKATANEPQVILLKTVVNYQGSAELIKKSEAGEVLANAEFKVYPAGATEAVTESLTSNKNGEVVATGLAPGDYYFKEVKAPAGYLLNTKEYGFTITAKAETKPTTIKVGNAINYQGSAQLVKRDDKGNPLADAEFKVTDEAGKTVESKLFSNTKGIVTVTGLAPGSYFFVETKAPTGFVTNDEKIGFTIPESNEGKHLLVLDKDLVNYQGSAQLIKKDEAGQRISGATFKVVDSNNKQVGEEIVSDEAGLVTVTGLAPGTYRFIETKPAPGFILNDTPRPFEIAANHEGQPTLVEAEELVNYSGSVTLEKKSATNEVLTGVSFDLFRNENEKIGTYQTDKNGKISVNNLESGSYYFLEVAAPTGYITNTEKIAFSIVEKATEKVEVVEVQATNYQGSAELIKVDGANKPLAGAEFQVFEDKKETAVLKEVLISDKDGKVSVTGLAPGKYYFQETKAPSGYIRNTTKHEFTIVDKAAGEPKVVSVANVVNYQGSAHLIKTDKKGSALKDAVFNVIDSEDTVVRENLKSDEKGLVKVTGLAPGKYFFVETKAPSGFVINSTPVEFTIEEEVEGEPTAVTDLKLTNFKGSAQLIKKDESGTPVKGAKFNVLDADKELVATDLASDRDGVVTVTGLAAGKYYFVETQAPSGFMLNDTPQAFEIKNSYSGEPTLEQAGELINYRGRVILTKTTADEKTPLENASFKLYAEPDTIIGTYTTDVKGEIKVNDLAPGKYYFEETQAPNKYVRNTEKVNFQIKAEATTTPEIVELDMINYQGSAELTKKGEDNEALAGAIFKVTDETGKDIATGLESDGLGKVFVENLAPGTYYFVETQAAPGHILNEEKVGFKIASENPGKPVTVKAGDFKNYQGKVELFKTDADGKGLRDAIFKLTDAVGQTVQENLKTDKRGRLEVNKIAPGTYYFVETKAPAGYMLNETPIEFKINEKAGNTATVVTAGTVINYRGSVTLNKEDGTGEPLANASFTLFDELDKEINTVTTDKKGQVTVKDLKPGNYYFLETEAPTGYLINTEKVEFTITDKATTAPRAEAVTATNYKGSVELIKVNETGEALADAQFKVMTEAGDTVKTELTSTKDGKVLVENLAPGNYYFEETAAPAGYVLNTTKVPFTIAEEAAGKPAIVDANATGKLSLTNYTASVEFNKISETNQPLEDAVFELTKADDKDFKKEVKSDKEGRVSVDGLAPGTYTFTETKAAPGYMLNTETIEFEIKPAVEGKPEVISLANFINYQGSAILTKVEDKNPLKKLANATFSLVDMDGKVINKELVTDKEGQISVTDLAPGTYYFVETSAPQGYDLDETPVKVDIKSVATGKPAVVMVTKTNKLTPTQPNKPDLPSTGKADKGNLPTNKESLPLTSSQSNVVLVVVGTGLVSLVVYVKRRKATKV